MFLLIYRTEGYQKGVLYSVTKNKIVADTMYERVKTIDVEPVLNFMCADLEGQVFILIRHAHGNRGKRSNPKANLLSIIQY